MAALARQHNIHLITNYETTWYATTHRAIELVTAEDQIGAIRKVVIHDGHRGPKEIGCSPEFLNWLTDPVQNGAGALVDFGCYGANLMTRLMGRAPVSVIGVTRQFKPDLYPRVDDDATIIVDYPGAQGIIQGSWNWAVSRKDMEIYGERGYVTAVDGSSLKTRLGDQHPEQTETLPPLPSPLDEPFAHFASVVRGKTLLAGNDLAQLENNLIVVRILELAKRSAQTGRAIGWDEAD
jgi:predicted dehydrogenase